jgi:lipid-binding SYLF domain-containing protein
MIFDQAADGVHIITAMLIVGFVFLGAIGIGELVRSFNHRRKARRPSSY